MSNSNDKGLCEHSVFPALAPSEPLAHHLRIYGVLLPVLLL